MSFFNTLLRSGKHSKKHCPDTSEKKSETQQPIATSPSSSCEGTSCANNTMCSNVLEPSYVAISTVRDRWI